MERRDFFKTILATPLMAPLLLSSSPSVNEELFLISDNPQIYLPPLIERMGTRDKTGKRRYAIRSDHPRKTALSQALETSGWTQAGSLRHADLTLSFRPLRYPASPSFTFVRGGRIMDIRKRELYSLWKKMGEEHPPSLCLTIAALQSQSPSLTPGTSVRIFHDGHMIEEMTLKKDRLQTFQSERGKVTMKIEQGNASISSSSCRHKICCSALPVSRRGERIVCAPNHFLLEIKGPGTIDTIIG